uniref:Uncharacterized protein n=1 Tax=Oryza rufipogon TaxID=4529 RepID=A0A0E0PVV3_ORYRU
MKGRSHLNREEEGARESRHSSWSSRAPSPLLSSSSRRTAMVKPAGNEGPKPFEWGRGGRWFRQARHDNLETKTTTAHGLARRQRAKLEFSGVTLPEQHARARVG